MDQQVIQFSVETKDIVLYFGGAITAIVTISAGLFMKNHKTKIKDEIMPVLRAGDKENENKLEEIKMEMVELRTLQKVGKETDDKLEIKIEGIRTEIVTIHKIVNNSDSAIAALAKTVEMMESNIEAGNKILLKIVERYVPEEFEKVSGGKKR